MEAFEKYKFLLNLGPLAHFPNGHIVAVSALCMGLLIATILPSDKASAKRHSLPIAIPTLNEIENTAEPQTVRARVAEPTTKTSEKTFVDSLSQTNTSPPVHFRKDTQTVKKGDNLSKIFKRAGLNDGHMMDLVNNAPSSKRLASLFPGHNLDFYLERDNTLARLTYRIDRLHSFTYSKTEKGFSFSEENREPDIKLAQSSATITTSLYNAGTKARLNDRLIMEFANIFGWDVDFALDIRKGDSFRVVYEEKFLDGEKIGNGSIVAAEFTNQGEKFQAVRYISPNGDINYYTPMGESMRKAFLRAPLDFRRISGNFNPRRLHPVFKTVRAHRGTDYAADRGTPVWASGDGKVIASAYSKANGNYVFIQHGNNIQTKYLHLHKRHVKKGQRVKQKQKIGTVGSTGYSTGPHLHYEFLISGVHRNPRTIVNKLPKAKSVAKAEMSRFLAQTQPLVAELNSDTAYARYASSETVNSSHP